MLSAIRLAGFRGFSLLDASVTAVSAFLGPNSSGKTTVLHAVRLACDLLRLALQSAYPPRVEREADGGPVWIVVTRDTILSPQDLLPLADWRAHFVDQEVGEGIGFEIQLVFEERDVVQDLRVTVSCARNQQLKLEVLLRSSAALEVVAGLSSRSPLLNQRLTALLSAHAPRAVLVPPFYGTVPGEEYRARAVIDRLLGSGDQSHVVRNLVAALEADQFVRLNAFLRDTLNGATLTYRTAGDALQTESPLVVRFQDTNGEIELSAAGAGLVNLVALFCALSRWRKEAPERPLIFLLDEPEAHLSPRLQADAAQAIASLVKEEFGAQLLMATHSVDILNRLAEQGHTLIRCDRSATPSAVALSSDQSLFEDLRTWADLTPYTAINFLASRRVLFCEGDDDQRLLLRLAELRYRNDSARLRRFRQWGIVQLKGASNAPVAALLSRLIQTEVVQAGAREAAFATIVVLDRDHERQPGMRTESKGGVSETRVVWSRHSLESLLLDPAILAAWVRARCGDAAPADLETRLGDALAAADADAALNDAAIDQLAARLATSDLLDEEGKRLGGEQKFVHALRRARALVQREPSVWQRGKDRGRHILNLLRPQVALPARNQLPSGVIQLVLSTDLNQIGRAHAGVPPEVGALLDWLSG